MIDYRAEVAKDLDRAEWLIKRLPEYDVLDSAAGLLPFAPSAARFAWHIRLTLVLEDRTVANAVRLTTATKDFPADLFESARVVLASWYEDVWLTTRGYLDPGGNWTEKGLKELHTPDKET